MLRLTTAALSLTLICSAFAQSTDPTLTFEVATIKPAAPPSMTGGRVAIRMGPSGGPGTADPGQINYTFMNLHQLIAMAWGLKNYQVTGPSTIDTDRYEITAKVPRGATKDDVKVMLQNLLKSRFGLKYHEDKKEMAVYALVAAKNGPKLTESADQSDPVAAPPAAPPSEGGPNATAGPPPPPDPKNFKMGRDGMPMMQGRPGNFSNAMMMTPNGARMKIAGKQVTVAQLADSLSTQLDKPCVDMTGLTKRYDIALDFAPDVNAMQGKMGGMMLPPGAPNVGGEMHGAGPAPDGPRAGNPEDAATLFTALGEQLGLKLESRKAPVQLFVVEEVSKSPTEN